MRAADPDNNTRSGASPSSPLHAEVRAAVEKFYRDYETDMAAVVPPIGIITDIKEQQRQSEHFWSKRMREAETAILQAVADALLSKLPPRISGRENLYERLEYEEHLKGIKQEWYDKGQTDTVDAVTRVIGELGGGSE